MKKLFLFFTLVLFSLNFSIAQVNFGAKAGVNFAKFSGDNDHSDTRTIFHVGFMSEIMVSDMFAVQPELLYSSQGAKYKNAEEFESFYDGEFKFDYINIPIIAKYYVAEGFSIEAGPQIGLLISAKDDWEDVDTGETGSDDVKDSFKGIDFGVNLGIGYKLEGGLNFGARYNLGLSDLNDDPTSYGDSTYKNSVIQVSVGYFFN